MEFCLAELTEVDKFPACAHRIAKAYKLPRFWKAFVASDTGRMVQYVAKQLGPRTKYLDEVDPISAHI